MIIKVIVTLKNGVLDPQGKAIQQTLNGMNFSSVNDVRQGKFFEINVNENDELGDPLISKEHILAFKWMDDFEIDFVNNELARINDFLQGMFRGVGIKLVDFKVEFGRLEKNGKKDIILADEISPDTCRLWDATCLLYTSPSPRDKRQSRMPSSA